MMTADEVKSKTPKRFWSKINFGEIDDCWEWTAFRWATGYGCFMKEDWSNARAHRFMYESLFGKTQLWVLHKCDNPSCVNPNHLYPGTAQNNADDMISRGRDRKDSPRGAKNGSAILTEEKVLEIRNKIASGATTRKLGKEYGVSSHTISMIGMGKLWKHICIGSVTQRKNGSKHNKAKLTEDQVKLIKMRLRDGESTKKLGDEFNVHRDTIWHIRKGTNWKHVQI